MRDDLEHAVQVGAVVTSNIHHLEHLRKLQVLGGEGHPAADRVRRPVRFFGPVGLRRLLLPGRTRFRARGRRRLPSPRPPSTAPRDSAVTGVLDSSCGASRR